MARKGWIYHNDGSITEKGTGITRTASGIMVTSDLPTFVSPIDGKAYSGRAGLREHNRRHDVINNEELVGLPQRTMNQEYKPDRKAIREKIIETAQRKGYL